MTTDDITQEMVNEFKRKANRMEASDLDVKKLLRDFNGDIDAAVQLVKEYDFK